MKPLVRPVRARLKRNRESTRVKLSGNHGELLLVGSSVGSTDRIYLWRFPLEWSVDGSTS